MATIIKQMCDICSYEKDDDRFGLTTLVTNNEAFSRFHVADLMRLTQDQCRSYRYLLELSELESTYIRNYVDWSVQIKQTEHPTAQTFSAQGFDNF